MATEEKMDVKERFKYLRMMKRRYEKADHKTKGRLLDEMEAITSLHRKHLIVRMNGPGPRRRKRRRERSRHYGEDVEEAIAIIADTLDWICAERLKPGLPQMARHLAAFGEMEVDEELLAKMERISISTVRRVVQRVQPEGPRLPRARQGRRSDSAAQMLVPVSVIPWDEPSPGHFEVDLVHHSRSGVEGDFICTIQCIDVLTGWSERFGIKGHTFGVMWRAFQTFARHCPLPVREVHSDNGSEFINPSLIGYFGEHLVHIEQTRGEPGVKNHNRFVEQKNSSLVRAYFTDLYLHTPEHLELMNDIYADMWLYYNFFQPVLRQVERKVVQRPNGTYSVRRKQDEAKTPLDRLLAAKPPISRETRLRLQKLRAETNPRALKRSIHQKLNRIYQLAEEDERRGA